MVNSMANKDKDRKKHFSISKTNKELSFDLDTLLKRESIDSEGRYIWINTYSLGNYHGDVFTSPSWVYLQVVSRGDIKKKIIL